MASSHRRRAIGIIELKITLQIGTCLLIVATPTHCDFMMSFIEENQVMCEVEEIVYRNFRMMENELILHLLFAPFAQDDIIVLPQVLYLPDLAPVNFFCSPISSPQAKEENLIQLMR